MHGRPKWLKGFEAMFGIGRSHLTEQDPKLSMCLLVMDQIGFHTDGPMHITFLKETPRAYGPICDELAVGWCCHSQHDDGTGHAAEVGFAIEMVHGTPACPHIVARNAVKWPRLIAEVAKARGTSLLDELLEYDDDWYSCLINRDETHSPTGMGGAGAASIGLGELRDLPALTDALNDGELSRAAFVEAVISICRKNLGHLLDGYDEGDLTMAEFRWGLACLANPAPDSQT